MKRKDLYEKMYFHEIEQRDKLNGRLQFPLAIILTLIGFLGFLLRDAGPSLGTCVSSVFFWLGWISAFFSLSVASYFFVRALWGNTYTFLATANESENYYQALLVSNKGVKKRKRTTKIEFAKHINNSFKEHSSSNGLLNDQRSLWIFKAIKCLLFAILFSMVSFGSHYLGTLGVIKVRQPIEVFIKNPIQTTEVTMTEKKNPAPNKNHPPAKKPEAPQPRRVIEDYSPKQSDQKLINERKKG